jgi:transaldolase
VTGKPLQQLAKHGQSVWVDHLSREFCRSGALDRMMREDAVVGVTSNPTIFQKAIAAEEAYRVELRDIAGEIRDPKEIFVRLAVTDVRDACDRLRPVFENTPHAASSASRHRDGYVSIEVDPRLAYDTEATTVEARRLDALIDRPNVLIKIPATPPGLPAIEDMIAEEVSINVTLIFSLERYTDVAEAYIRGLERLVAAGGNPRHVASVASFFVSRVDTEVDRRLERQDGGGELKGKVAIANAKLAYQRYKSLFAGERWDFLSSKGATSQRCLWASTSTKNPAYRDVLYVEQLIGPETVTTLPLETAHAFQDHGEVRASLERGADEAEQLFTELGQAGVAYDDVMETLEAQGVRAFSDSFTKLLDEVARNTTGSRGVA